MPKPEFTIAEVKQMINRKPLDLTTNDMIETRLGACRTRWPRDPDTTERLKRVIDSDVNRPRYKVNPLIGLFLILFCIVGLVLLVNSMR